MTAKKRTLKEKAILKAAKELFWKFGIKKISIEEICLEADVSRMTFYRAFKNKEQVAELVIEEIILEGEQGYIEVMKSKEAFPLKIEKLIAFKYQQVSTISKAFLTDLFALGSNTFLKKLETHRNKLRGRIEMDFKQAQEEGWINPDLSMSFIIYMLNDLDKKMEDQQLLQMYTHPSKLIMDLTHFFFSGIGVPHKRFSK